MICSNLEDTSRCAADFLARLLSLTSKPGSARVVALSGELGSGKTSFTQAIARELGIKAKVASPTFIIERIYKIPNHPVLKRLIHIDAYRLDSVLELEQIGWADIIREPSSLILIEWPERVARVMPPDTHYINFKHINDNSRELKW
jgi:tRNA threonylcarbamoyladenosine biosynthesis protein TsaE